MSRPIPASRLAGFLPLLACTGAEPTNGADEPLTPSTVIAPGAVASLACEDVLRSADPITNEYELVRACEGVDMGPVLWRGPAAAGPPPGTIEYRTSGAIYAEAGWPPVGVYGALYEALVSMGDVYLWGWPLVREREYWNLRTGDRRGRFLLLENGTLTWHPDRGIHAIARGVFNDALFHDGNAWATRPSVGMPLENPRVLHDPFSGAPVAQVLRLEHAALVAEPGWASRVFTTSPSIFDRWEATLGFGSNNLAWDLGMPVASAAWRTVGGHGFLQQDYARGRMFLTPAGAFAVSQHVAYHYEPRAACLGAPISDPLWWENGYGGRDAYIQYFQGGNLTVTAASYCDPVRNPDGTFGRCRASHAKSTCAISATPTESTPIACAKPGDPCCRPLDLRTAGARGICGENLLCNERGICGQAVGSRCNTNAECFSDSCDLAAGRCR